MTITTLPRTRGGALAQRKPEALEAVPGGFRCRVRLGPFGRPRIVIRHCTEAEAEKRSKLMADIARNLVAAGHGARAKEIVTSIAEARDAASVKDTVAIVHGLCRGKIKVKQTTGSNVTFRSVAKEWTSDELHQRFPDHVKAKDHAHDIARLEKLCAVDVGGRELGDVPIGAFKIDHAEAAMLALPDEAKRPATRRAYAQLIHRVVALAVSPCRYIESNPLPKGFLPKVGKSPAYAFLYPAEDAALLACTEIPLAFRVLYGFLAREGLRVSEGLGLSWNDVDLERGVVTLDKNKTDDARAWASSPGVTRALRAWQKHGAYRLVFVHEGESIELAGLAKRLRGHLRAAGINRSELHKSTENRGRFRVHDLRGTFVTLSLANGRSETWVADRTGHTSSQMINRYRRSARSAAELGLGEPLPLDWAIPELNPLPGIVAALAALCAPRASAVTHAPATPEVSDAPSDANANGPRRSLGGPQGGPQGGPEGGPRTTSGARELIKVQGFSGAAPELTALEHTPLAGPPSAMQDQFRRVESNHDSGIQSPLSCP